MNRHSQLMLWGAVGIGVAAVAVILLFGLRFGPGFPDLYADGGPTIDGTVAFVTEDDDTCAQVLDVATGEQREIYCSQHVWIGGWDGDGNLVVHEEDVYQNVLTIDPVTGDVVSTGTVGDIPPVGTSSLRAASSGGHATLSYVGAGSSVVLIDAEGPRNYRFLDRGLTAEGKWAWVLDSENRLLVVALDGSSGPWVVKEGIHEVSWK